MRTLLLLLVCLQGIDAAFVSSIGKRADRNEHQFLRAARFGGFVRNKNSNDGNSNGKSSSKNDEEANDARHGTAQRRAIPNITVLGQQIKIDNIKSVILKNKSPNVQDNNRSSSKELATMKLIVADLADQIVNLNAEITELRGRLIQKRSGMPTPPTYEPEVDLGSVLEKKYGLPKVQDIPSLSTPELRSKLQQSLEQQAGTETRLTKLVKDNQDLRTQVETMQSDHAASSQALQAKLDFQVAMRAREQQEAREKSQQRHDEHDAQLQQLQDDAATNLQHQEHEWRDRMSSLERDLQELTSLLGGANDRLELRGELIRSLQSERKSVRKLISNGLGVCKDRVTFKGLRTWRRRKVRSIDEIVAAEMAQRQAKRETSDNE